MKNFNVRLENYPSLADTIKTSMENLDVRTNGDFLKLLVDMVPVYAAMQAKGLSIAETIERINSDNEVKTVIQTIRKGANEQPFEVLKQKVMTYNKQCADIEYRIELTPSLFYKVIGGNVKAIQALYEKDLEEITKHNESMGLGGNKPDSYNNRKLAKRIGTDLYEWVKKTIGYNQ
jgi:hypothetical protein